MRLADRVRLASLRAAGFRSRAVPSSLGDMHVLEGHGTGPIPAVVLLHGLGAAAVDFGPLMRHLRSWARRILVPDLPGHGRSPAPAGQDLPVVQRALDETLDQILGTGPPALIYGNSLGGLAAVRYAGSRPDRVSGLFLASPAGARTSAEELRQVLGPFRVKQAADARALMKQILPSGHWMGPAMEVGLRVRMRNPFVGALVDHISHEHTLEPRELRTLAMPVLVTWGRRELLLPRSHFDYYRAHLPDHAVVEEPAAAGHVEYLESPRAVATRLGRFWHQSVAAR